MDKEEDIEKKDSQNISPSCSVHEIVQVMADFINYLSVSLYQEQFTQMHHDSYLIIHTIYNTISSKPHIPPSLYDIEQFYNNINYLGNVTYTDDPDYYTYKRKLRKYIMDLRIINLNHTPTTTE